MGIEFEIKDVQVVKDKLVKVTAKVKQAGKRTYVPFFMVRYGDASNLEEIIALEWEYDIETVVKHFIEKALELGLKEFKVIDGVGYEYIVKVETEEM